MTVATSQGSAVHDNIVETVRATVPPTRLAREGTRSFVHYTSARDPADLADAPGSRYFGVFSAGAARPTGPGGTRTQQSYIEREWLVVVAYETDQDSDALSRLVIDDTDSLLYELTQIGNLATSTIRLVKREAEAMDFEWSRDEGHHVQSLSVTCVYIPNWS